MTAVSEMKVPFFNYSGAFKLLEQEFTEIFSDVIDRGAFIQQKDLVDFERNLANYLNIKHAFGVGNATDGLTIIWKAIGLNPGDEVIFPSHTMVASPASVVHAGGTPVAVDCGDDHLINAKSIEAAITEHTRAVMPVHLNGRTADMDSIESICRKYNLVLVEDAAQALGSRFKGKHAGTFGIAAAFSFYPAKLLGCLGDGGAVVTNDDEVARKIEMLRDHGRSPITGKVETWGYNSRLDNLQAAFLDVQLRDYDTYVHRRRQIAQRYIDGLGNISQIHLPPSPSLISDHFDVFQNFEIEVENRDRLQEYLSHEGIGTIRQWGGFAVHQFPALRVRGVCPRTELLFERCLMLPMNTVITDEEVNFVVKTIVDFYNN